MFFLLLPSLHFTSYPCKMVKYFYTILTILILASLLSFQPIFHSIYLQWKRRKKRNWNINHICNHLLYHIWVVISVSFDGTKTFASLFWFEEFERSGWKWGKPTARNVYFWCWDSCHHRWNLLPLTIFGKNGGRTVKKKKHPILLDLFRNGENFSECLFSIKLYKFPKAILQYICLNLFPIIYLNFLFLCSVFYTSTNEFCCLLTCRPGHHKHFATISIHLSPRKRGVFLLKSFFPGSCRDSCAHKWSAKLC